ncbi:transcription factor bHLH [Forsythia ovata]|uniref:Transcription factor bHLH n=1 Tax=Forsythia ovata TaxID=205694 RepID=A0ABD1T9K3_9LAMI
MEKNFGSWFYHDQQSRNQNSLGSPIHTGPLNAVPAYMNRYSVEFPTIGTSPVFPGSVTQPSKASEPNDTQNSLHFLPCFRQAFAPAPNPVFKERLPTASLENLGVKGSPDTGSRTAQKKFLVFDQSGGKTNLIYSSVVETPVQCTTLSRPKPPSPYVLIKEEAWHTRSPLGPIMNDEYIASNYKHDMKSETHEDTEELNALLCSDGDSDCSEDDEATSTGRSPPTMTHYHVPVLGEEGDVLRSAEPTKRQKLLHGGCDVPQLTQAEFSLKTYTSSELEDDAESGCGNANSRDSKESGFVSGKKRSRKDEVLETLNILRRIVPGGKGKDAIVIIDEAIHYLRSLKAKAKVLGLDTH